MDMMLYLSAIGFLLFAFVALVIIERHERKPQNPKKTYKEERRAYPRYKVSLRVKYKTALEEGISWIEDISEGGARLFLNKALKTLQVGESLGIEITIPPDSSPILVHGNIVWSKDAYAGLSFSKVITGDIQKIIQYINAGQTSA
ncbi:MAG: PilZ domain-containing protein [Candidatus Omnitrophota bacterium]|nr:MAG: PilZ domain-containing protein [Candidatus Omnitrophota bacterium]